MSAIPVSSSTVEALPTSSSASSSTSRAYSALFSWTFLIVSILLYQSISYCSLLSRTSLIANSSTNFLPPSFLPALPTARRFPLIALLPPSSAFRQALSPTAIAFCDRLRSPAFLLADNRYRSSVTTSSLLILSLFLILTKSARIIFFRHRSFSQPFEVLLFLSHYQHPENKWS